MSKLDLSPYLDEAAYNALVDAVNDAIQRGKWEPDGRRLSEQAYQMYMDARKAEDRASGLQEGESWYCDDNGNRIGKMTFVPVDIWKDDGPFAGATPEPARCPSCGEWLPMTTMWGVGNRLAPLYLLDLATGERRCGKCATKP